MTDSFIQVAPDSTGKKVDSEALTVGAHTVDRQRFIIADPLDAAGKATVLNTVPGPNNHGITVRDASDFKATTGTISVTDSSGTAAPGLSLVTGTPTATSYVAAQLEYRLSTVIVYITGLTSGTLYFEESANSTNGIDGNWAGSVLTRQGAATSTLHYITTTNNSAWKGSIVGASWFRVRAIGALTGTPTIYIVTLKGVESVALQRSLPTGSGMAGSFRISADAAGTNLAAVQNTVPAGSEYGVAVRPIEPPSALCVTATAALNTATTLTLPAPGASLFQYITRLDLALYATAARTGAAAPVLVTTTNLPGSLAFTFETAQAIGTMIRQDLPFPAPFKASVANTAVTVAAPAVAAGIWRLTAFYYVAP